MKGTSNIENLLMDYSKIDKSNYKAKVQFYEERRGKISELLTRDKLELDIDYTFALFELGKYIKCLATLEILIEQVIRENIFKIDGEDVFQSLLFKKSACHYNLGEPKKSMHVLQELIKMNPKDETYQIFFKRCNRNELKQAYRWMSGLVVGLFLLAAFIISIRKRFYGGNNKKFHIYRCNRGARTQRVSILPILLQETLISDKVIK